MSRFGASSRAQVAASPSACFQLVCDTPRTPEWHQAVAAVEVLQRGGDGRSSLVRTSIDAVVARVQVDLRISYEQDRALRMHREAGDLRDLTVTWTFDELPGGRTQASFEVDFDPGRVLSLLAKGPVVARLQALLAEQPPQGLKQAVELGRTSA